MTRIVSKYFCHSPLKELMNFTSNPSLSLHKDEKCAASSLGLIFALRGLADAISSKGFIFTVGEKTDPLIIYASHATETAQYV